MPNDFGIAAARHFRDGILLQTNSRIDNADQLFGFAAECGIKTALMAVLGVAANGELAQKYRLHVRDLWERVPLQSLQGRFSALVTVLKFLRPFENWSTDQRYGPDAVVTEQILAQHHRAAERVLVSVGIPGLRKGG